MYYLAGSLSLMSGVSGSWLGMMNFRQMIIGVSGGRLGVVSARLMMFIVRDC